MNSFVRRTPSRVRVFPLNWLSDGRVGVDVTTKFARQVGDRGEDSVRHDLALDFGEPDLDLIEPRSIGWGEVKLYPRMALEKITHDYRLPR